MNPRLALLVASLLLAACPSATTSEGRATVRLTALDTLIPAEPGRVHQWVRPRRNQCPEATLPAPGETPDPEIQRTNRVIAGMKPAFSKCFRQFVGRHPAFERGSLRLTLGVDCEGQVTSARGVTTGLDRGMVACVMRAAVATRFEPPSAGIGLVSIPITFRN